MSKLNKAVLGNIQGKVGNVVGRKFRSEYVVAAYQPKVRNPRTMAQQLIRARLGAVSTLSNNMAVAINRGLRNAAKGTKWTPRNLFVKLNFDRIHAASPGSVSIDYTTLVLAQGSLSTPIYGAPIFDNPNQVAMSYNFDGVPGGHANYEIETVLYNPDLGLTIMKATAPQNASGNIVVDCPASWNGMKVHIWCWVKYRGENDVESALYTYATSASSYCGSGNIS